MKIALIHDYLNQFGGGERVLLSLMKLFPDAPVYTLMYDKEKTYGLFEGRVKQTSFLDFHLARRHHRWFIPLMPFAIAHMNLRAQYDLIISDTAGFAKGINYDRAKTKHISYIHTPLRYAWETSNYFGGSWYAKLFSFIFRPAFSYVRNFDYQVSKRPDVLLANSHYIAGKIKKYYKRGAEVVYPPITDGFFRTTSTTKGDYYLALGRFLEYKRFDLIIDACLKGEFNLKIVGDGRLAEELKRISHGSPRIEFLPFQTDEKLRELYSSAKAFIMANDEDFGMVMVEAQACGTPVIAYAKGGALEIVEDGRNGVLFNEQTPESLLAAITRFEALKFDPSAIKKSAERFSEENFKKGIQEAVRSVS